MMMITVNRSEKTINGAVNGKPFAVAFSQAKYDEMKRLEKEVNEAISMTALRAIIEEFTPLTEDAFKELVETASPNLLVNEATGKFYLKLNKTVHSHIAVPQPLVDRILKSVEMGIDCTPIVKFWTRCLRAIAINPFWDEEKAARLCRYVNKTIIDHEVKQELIEKKGVSPEVAIERATFFQTPITTEGLLCTYKVSEEIDWKFDKEGKKVSRYETEYDEIDGTPTVTKPEAVEERLFQPAVQRQNGDPFFCYDVLAVDRGKARHVIQVGKVIELENWSMVNTDDSVSCRPGLHVGNRDYISGYQRATTVTHNIFIDPVDVGAITDDGSGALRVKRYYVHSSNAGINRSIYHSSTFAAKTDKEWADYRKAAIEESEAKAKEHKEVLKAQAEL